MTQISDEMRKYRACVRQAAGRNIPFLLTFEQWWDIWQQSGHWHERGNLDGDKYCMARHGDVGPYAVGNVKIITNRENSIEGGAHPKPRQPRLRIEVPGDILVLRTEAARELGVAACTLRNMRPPTVMLGGFAYVAIGKLRQQIASGLTAPKKRGARR
jgi:hypothetical protein